jgi:polyadenylation factor subunit 2
MNNLTAWQGSSSREAIRGLSFSPDDQRFATASDDSSVRIWSFQESRVESVLTGGYCLPFSYIYLFFSFMTLGHGWDVKCVQWHPTKGLLVSGSKDNQIKFWDPRTGTVLSTLYEVIFSHILITCLNSTTTDINIKTQSKHFPGPLTVVWSPRPQGTKLSASSTSAQ